MANTYSAIYVHFVFAVKHRDAKLAAIHRPRIHSFMKQITRNKGHIPIAVGGTDNHVHVLIQYNPKELISEYIKDLKTSTTKFINSEIILNKHFEWQRGYGAFSHSYRDITAVKNYIINQVEHHNGETFLEEVHRMFDRCGIVYTEQYLFDDM